MAQDWLNDVLTCNEEYESPIRFIYWSALAAVSAVLKDSIWVDMAGRYKLYPNIYVMIYGPPAIRKGPPINLAKKIVSIIDNTRVISGRASIQAIVKELGTAYSRPGKPPIIESKAFIVASEFASSLVEDPAAFRLLTDLYDRLYNDGEWKNLLKQSGVDSLKDPTITMLVGTNEAHFKDFIPEKDIKGGYIGRTFMITEQRRSKLNSLMYKPDKVPDEKALAEALRPVSLFKGEMVLEDAVRINHDKWYRDFFALNKDFEDETGSLGRLADSVLKTGILLAIARRQEMLMRLIDWEEAIEVCLPLIGHSNKVVIKSNNKDISFTEKKGLIFAELCNAPGNWKTRSTLLKKFGLQMNAGDLDIIIETFNQAKVVFTETTGNGDVIYTIKAEIVEQYNNAQGKIK